MSRICPDGVELVRRQNYPDLRYLRYGSSGPDWFVDRSDREERRLVRDAVDLGDALVVRFVNAITDAKRIDFLSAFGMPIVFMKHRDVGPGLAEPRNVVLGQQRALRRLLREAGSGNAARANKAANEALRLVGPDRRSLEPDGRFVWIVGEPLSFMHLEIACAAQTGARIGACQRCGVVFLHGQGTGKRETKKYCGAACRVGAYRAIKRGD